MKKNLLLILFLFVGAWSHAQTFTNYQYEIDDSNFANPERGFYRHTETSSGSYSYLNTENLQSYREEGYTVMLRLFYLTDFVSKPISEKYLSSMQQDFNSARAAGVKLIVRFAYTKKSSSPYGDATPEWALSHIAQLKPVLQANGDVIAVVQAGFIGAWGEWYYTDHFSAVLGVPNANDWNNRRALVNALLDATPKSRAVELRTPGYKFMITNSTEPLDETEAFTMTARARLGHHNDCFLASETDYGTYTSNMEEEKAFLEQETLYLPIGGETCGEYVPLSECPNAMAQMERFHWSFLNRDYHSGVIGSWESDDCLDEVYNKLGYRFRLTKSSLQTTTKPGGIVNFKIHLVNDGWANPYNGRNVELVLRNKTSGKRFTLPLHVDPRLWSLNDTIKVEAEGGIPSNVLAGEYDLLLNLPDPEITLRENPAYSVRLANIGTWEAESGFNSLQHTLTVDPAANIPTYSGEDFFLSDATTIEDPNIEADGQPSDWNNVESISSGVDPAHELKAFNDLDHLYLAVMGTNATDAEIFIDADPGGTQGVIIAPWILDKADYKVSSSGFSTYVSGSWSSPMPITFAVATGTVEFEIPLEYFSTIVPEDNIRIAAKALTGGGDIFLPASGLGFANYTLNLGTPSSLNATSSGTKVILYWANNVENSYRVIQRSDDGTDFSTIAVISPENFTFTDRLTAVAATSYRSYYVSENSRQTSVLGESIAVNPAERPLYYEYSTDGDDHEWEDVVPLATALVDNSTVAYKIFFTASHLNILIKDIDATSLQFYFDIDNDPTTGSDNNPWEDTGFDFLIENDALFDLRSGAPVLIQSIMSAAGENLQELSVPIELLDNLSDNTTIRTAAHVTAGGSDTFLPGPGTEPPKFIRTKPAPTPTSFTVSNSETLPKSQLIIQWTGCSGCAGYVVERSVNNPDNFSVLSTKGSTTFAHYDNGLTEGTEYYYHVMSYNEAGLSIPTDSRVGIPGAVTSVAESRQPFSVYPNPVSGYLTISAHGRANGKVLITDALGRRIDAPVISKSDDGVVVDTSSMRAGLYFVSVPGVSGSARIVKK